MSEMIESQKEEIYRAYQGDDDADKIINFFMNSY